MNLFLNNLSVELLTSPTEDIGKLLACLSKIKIGGKSDLLSSIQVAQLSLKHRKNKNVKLIILFYVYVYNPYNCREAKK
jgi:26S proteasome regulatory subunit N10